MNLPLFLAGPVWRLIKRFWWAIPLLALALLWWRADSLRAGYKADLASVRTEYAAFQKEVTTKATEALIAQKAVNAAQEQVWKDKAHEADASIDDLRARLRAALLRPQAGGSAGSGTSAAAQTDGPGVPQGVPTPAGSAAGSVCVNPDILAGLAAYAIQAHEWAISLDQPNP